MRAVAPRVGCPEQTLAEEQTEYAPLTVAFVDYADGSVGTMTRWRLDDAERAQLADGADLYVSLLTFGERMQPISLLVGRPDWAPEEER